MLLHYIVYLVECSPPQVLYTFPSDGQSRVRTLLPEGPIVDLCSSIFTSVLLFHTVRTYATLSTCHSGTALQTSLVTVSTCSARLSGSPAVDQHGWTLPTIDDNDTFQILPLVPCEASTPLHASWYPAPLDQVTVLSGILLRDFCRYESPIFGLF